MKLGHQRILKIRLEALNDLFQVTSINPQQVFGAIGDSLQSVAQGIQNASPGAAAADTIRTGYREFSSLLF